MSEFWFRFFYFLAWPFFNLFHPGKVYGRENIPEGAALLCGNHTRYSDPLFIVFALGHRDHPAIMGKAELFRWPGLRWILRKVGVIPVERGKSDVKAVKESLRALKDGRKLLIFPEGTRFKDGETQGAKTGAAMMSLRTGAPIVPIWMPAKKRWFRRTPVVFGAPYHPQAPQGRHATPDEYRDIAADMMERIFALSQGFENGK